MYRAVMVDDEPFMLEGMRTMIDWASCGFTLCGEAASAQEALHLVDSLQPHLLITDVRMPGMLGTDLATIVHRYHPDTVVVFFSGYRDFAYAQCAIRSHVFGYLVKPIDVDEVQDTLRRVKAELDQRLHAAPDAVQSPILRDLVLRRIAMGDDSSESLLRVGVLMGLKREDPCYCAMIACEHGPFPENVKLALSASGGTPFMLSPTQYGLGFRQFERDVAQLVRLQGSFPAPLHLRLSVGGLGRGPQGFCRSLREALEAQGVLFELRDGVRQYRPFDARAAAWLAHVKLAQFRGALSGECPDALDALLPELRAAITKFQPDAFSLRYMAASLDAILPAPGLDDAPASLRPLWQNGILVQEEWLAAFEQCLLHRRQAQRGEGGDCWPVPVQATLAAIRTHYAEPLSMADISQTLHINPAYLGQLVRRHTGATFHRLLLDTRIGHACTLLRQTSRPVGDIALEVGFRDVDYFSQQFRSRMGMSPVAYRTAGAPDTISDP